MAKKTKISYFKNVSDTYPKTISLEDWLKKTIKPPKNLDDLVKKYRNLKSQRLKQTIPCVTISSQFKNKRNLKNIKSKNGLICLDIDPKENPVANMKLVKDLLSTHPSCLYCGFSVSNNGVYAIIKIKRGVSLKKYFKHFEKSLKSLGIIIDKSCKDYTRLRFFSVDKKAYYNKKAKTYQITKKKIIKPKHSENTRLEDFEKVETVIKLIESNQIDITENYQDWIKLAGSLYNGFGEKGRSYFHRISKFYPKYSEKKTNRKFDNCKNMSLDLSTFFYIANNYRIRY